MSKWVTDANEVGDSFGWINALFSGLAFVGLLVTLQMQSQELKQNTKALDMQAEELQATRKEMANQSKEFEKQSEIIEQQKELLSAQIKAQTNRDFSDEFFKRLEFWMKHRDS